MEMEIWHLEKEREERAEEGDHRIQLRPGKAQSIQCGFLEPRWPGEESPLGWEWPDTSPHYAQSLAEGCPGRPWHQSEAGRS